MSDSSSANQSGPFEEQRRIFDLLSQETRHLIVQYVLGHPEHLPSLDELDYMIPKSKAAIGDQLDNLVEAGVLDVYRYEPSVNKRDLPSKFYGFTERGVEILHEYNYLRGVPVAQALYKNTRKSEKIKRHENAPRPELPKAVREPFSNDSKQIPKVEEEIRDRKGKTRSVDDQVKLVMALFEAETGPDHEGLKRSEMESHLDVELEFTLGTILNHLSEIDLVQRVSPPGPDFYVISERTDEIVNGRIEEEVKQNLEGLIAHIDEEPHFARKSQFSEEGAIAVTDGAGRTLRSILAEEFSIMPEKVEPYLRKGNSLEKLNAAIEAIERSESITKREEYDKIIFRRQAYRYRLTEKAVKLAKS
ncbi:hypothetical protein [Halorussus aquaticus]|uniref:HTH arsR-type domain-containing protein n=1 Tax=Halorussus aquaticus TaxID=2953748 RepID=A0ABD5Q303_9EURY|nr:hypothetical protein [Halorussus aquaticus]